MQLIRLFAFLLILSLTQSCKKEAATETATPMPAVSKGEKVKREHGQPIGTAVTLSIGATGGNISSADGRMTIIVPAGAVEAATQFSVQPVENTLETRALSYRLSPEGIAFKKEVTVRYSYAGMDLAGADSKYLFLAYQDAAGYYHEASRTQANNTTQTLSVATKHFSDWTFFSRVELETDRRLQNGKAFLKKSEAMKLEVHTYKGSTQNTGDTEPELEYYFNPEISSAVWTLSKPKGTLTPMQLLHIADYKAPAAITQQESLMINATLTGTFGTDNLGQPVKQLILGQEVVLQPDDEDFFEVTVDGGVQQLHTVTASLVPGYMSIGGYLPNGHVLSMYIYGSGAAAYACGQAGQTGKCTIEYSIPGGVGFLCFRPVRCDIGGGLVYATGGVTLTKVAAQIGDYTEGTLSTQLFDVDWCGQGRTKNISGRFKIRKQQ